MRHYCLGGCSAPSVCARRSRPVRGARAGTWCCVSPVSPFPPRVSRAACGGPSRPGVPYPRSLVRHSTRSALLVVPACPLRVCALALPRRPLPPPLGGVACAPRAVPALGAGRAVPRGPCPSACPAPVPRSVWRAWGGAVRSRFPPTWLGAVRHPCAVGAGVWVWGPNIVPLACMPCGGCVPRGWWGDVPGGGGLPLL